MFFEVATANWSKKLNILLIKKKIDKKRLVFVFMVENRIIQKDCRQPKCFMILVCFVMEWYKSFIIISHSNKNVSTLDFKSVGIDKNSIGKFISNRKSDLQINVFNKNIKNSHLKIVFSEIKIFYQNCWYLGLIKRRNPFS